MESKDKLAIDQLLVDFDLKLREIEKKTYSGDHKQFPEALQQLLNLATQGADSGPYSGLMGSNVDYANIYAARMASCFIAMILNENLELNDDLLIMLLAGRYILYEMLEASAFSGAAHARNILFWQQTNEDGQPQIQGMTIAKCVLLSSLDKIPSEFIDYIVKGPQERGALRALLSLSLLNDRSILTAQGEANRTRLLQECDVLYYLPVQPRLANMLARVWMLCSYATCEHKHKIKIPLNAWYCKLAASLKVIPASVKRPADLRKSKKKHKKTLVVVAEVMREGHAMYRWYAAILRELAKEYNMVLVASKEDVDDTVCEMFDACILLKSELNELHQVVQKLRPDIVYYPSLGMRAWTLVLANVRWAPVQVMSLGHPATSYIKTMDGVIIARNLFGKMESFSENILQLNSVGGTLAKNETNIKLTKKREFSSEDKLVHVAVPCISLKINSEFINVLIEIERRSSKKIIYNFYPNRQGFAHSSINKKIISFFKDAVIHKRDRYENYIESLSRNKLALSPFPFGNASSLVDCILLNLPSVSLVADEPHSRSDYVVLAQENLEENYCFKTKEDYINKALSEIESGEGVFYKESRKCPKEPNNFTSEMCNLFEWLMGNAEKFRSQEQKHYSGDVWSKNSNS